MTADIKDGNGGRTKAPAFQWYPGNHRRDTALQTCTFEARALWRDMLDLMHDGEPYGHLTAGGVAITETQLARIEGLPVARVGRWLKELEDRRVFSRSENGVIYSRRMVRDERVRRARALGGKKSLDNPNVPRPKREQGSPEGYPPATPSSVSSHPSLGGSPAVALASASASALQDQQHPASPAAGAAPALTVIADATMTPARRKTWLAPYGDVWKAEMGGEMPHGQAATVFKKLEADGRKQPEIITNLRRYCLAHQGQRARFASLSKFGETFAQWSQQAAEAGASRRNLTIGERADRRALTPAQQEQADRYARMLTEAMDG